MGRGNAESTSVRAVARTSATQGMTALHLHWSTKATIGDIDRAVDDAFRTLGYPFVKEEQREALRCVLSGRDCFVTLPTGYGKSAIFHALPLCASALLERFSGTSVRCGVVVISPLVSLMTDQVSKLRRVGISSVVQLSEFSPLPEAITHLFTSPEALMVGSRSRKYLLQSDDFLNSILAIVVDEAHCIVKW